MIEDNFGIAGILKLLHEEPTMAMIVG